VVEKFETVVAEELGDTIAKAIEEILAQVVPVYTPAQEYSMAQK